MLNNENVLTKAIDFINCAAVQNRQRGAIEALYVIWYILSNMLRYTVTDPQHIHETLQNTKVKLEQNLIAAFRGDEKALGEIKNVQARLENSILSRVNGTIVYEPPKFNLEEMTVDDWAVALGVTPKQEPPTTEAAKRDIFNKLFSTLLTSESVLSGSFSGFKISGAAASDTRIKGIMYGILLGKMDDNYHYYVCNSTEGETTQHLIVRANKAYYRDVFTIKRHIKENLPINASFRGTSEVEVVDFSPNMDSEISTFIEPQIFPSIWLTDTGILLVEQTTWK